MQSLGMTATGHYAHHRPSGSDMAFCLDHYAQWDSEGILSDNDMVPMGPLVGSDWTCIVCAHEGR